MKTEDICKIIKTTLSMPLTDSQKVILVKDLVETLEERYSREK